MVWREGKGRPHSLKAPVILKVRARGENNRVGMQRSWGMRERASGTVYMEIAGKVLY